MFDQVSIHSARFFISWKLAARSTNSFAPGRWATRQSSCLETRKISPIASAWSCDVLSARTRKNGSQHLRNWSKQLTRRELPPSHPRLKRSQSLRQLRLRRQRWHLRRERPKLRNLAPAN